MKKLYQKYYEKIKRVVGKRLPPDGDICDNIICDTWNLLGKMKRTNEYNYFICCEFHHGFDLKILMREVD